MSKIGRKPIRFTTAQVEIKGNQVAISGPMGKESLDFPPCLELKKSDKTLVFGAFENTRENRALWGLNRALLANKILGVEKGFKREMKIEGLGFKAQASGNKIVFTLGYSHKVDFLLPAGVKVEIDKTGQALTFTSIDKFLLGNTCDSIRSLRPPEPYKGTGIMFLNEKIHRKAGKTKSA